MGNTSTKHHLNGRDRPKKFVHWKTAEAPSPPGKPQLSPATPDAVILQWARPLSDGGAPILGYMVEHRRTGAADWVRFTSSLIPVPELILSGLPPGWRYQFRVSAENVVGRSQPSELSDQLTVTIQRNLPFNAPQFVDELQDMVAVENEKVEFRTCVNGVPMPQINWFKDGFEIFSSRRTKIVNENGTSLLVIHQAALTDEGEIKCTATNRVGHASTKARLILEAPPKIRLPRQYEDGLLVEADETIRLKVGIAGRPAPEVVWKHNGTVVESGGRFELETNEKNSSLKINGAKREDRGEYYLRAFNKLGDDIASFLVTVTSKPEPPGRVHIAMSIGKSVTLVWAMPNDDGGCKIGNYIVEYYRIGWNVWLKAVATRQLTATISDLIEGSEYKFRVKAENPYGLSEPSHESDVLIVPDSRTPKAAPRRRRGNSVHSSRSSLNGDDTKQSATTSSDAANNSQKQKSPRPTINIQLTPQILDSETNIREMTYGAPSNLLLYVPGTKAPREPTNVEFKPQSILKKTQINEQHERKMDDVNKETQKMPARPAGAKVPEKVDLQAANRRDEAVKNVQKVVASAPTMTTGIVRKQSVISDTQTDEVHTSGEFMLVLYPKDEEKINEKQISYDLDLEDAIPPPMSLSAPDLRSEMIPVIPMLRRYASSTELLYERAMARFYQAVEIEEAEKARRSASVEPQRVRRLSSFGESDRKYQQILSNLNKREADAEASRNTIEAQTSIDESEVSYVSEQESYDPRNDSRPYTPALSVDYEDDYTASTATSDDSLEKFKSLVMAHNFKSLDEDELETYHPRSMEPRTMETRTIVKSHLVEPVEPQPTEPQPIEQQTRESRSLESRSKEPRALSPYRLPEPDQSSVALTRPFPTLSPDFVPKPILKRPSIELEQNSVTLQSPPRSPAPEKPERKSLRSPEQSTTNIDQIAQIPIAIEISATSLVREVIEVEEKKVVELTEAQKKRLADERRKQQQRQNSIEENKVIIEHYSDIVNTLGKTPVAPKVPIYLNTEALRKAAEEAEAEELLRGELNKYISEPEDTQELKDPPRMAERKISKRDEIPLADRAPIYKGPVEVSQRQSVDLVEPPEVTEFKQLVNQQSNAAGFDERDGNINGTLFNEDTRGRSTTAKGGPKPRKSSSGRSRSNSALRRPLTVGPPDQQAAAPRNLSKTRKRDPSTQRSRTPLINPPDTDRPFTPQEMEQQHLLLQEAADHKVKSTLNYVTDLAMFLFACWLYIFKDARLAIPVLVLMIYRQLGDAVRSRLPKWLTKRLSRPKEVNGAHRE